MRIYRQFLFLIAVATTAFLGTNTQAGADEVTLRFGPPLKQPDSLTCGPTCAVMVLNHYGINAGIGPVAQQSDTYLLKCCGDWLAGGIEFGFTLTRNLARSMKDNGLPVDVRTGTPQDLRASVNEGKPAILLVRSALDLWHYIVVTGYRTSPAQFRIHDTNRDVYWMDEADLVAIWRFSHRIGNRIGDRMTTEFVEDLQCISCQGRGENPATVIDLECAVCGGSGKVAIVIDTFWGRRYRHGWGTCGACKGCGRWRTGGHSVTCHVCSGSGHGDPARKIVESFEAGSTFLVPSASRDPQPPPPPAPPIGTPAPPGQSSEEEDLGVPQTPDGTGCGCHRNCTCHQSQQRRRCGLIEAIRLCREHRRVLGRCCFFH